MYIINPIIKSFKIKIENLYNIQLLIDNLGLELFNKCS